MRLIQTMKTAPSRRTGFSYKRTGYLPRELYHHAALEFYYPFDAADRGYAGNTSRIRDRSQRRARAADMGENTTPYWKTGIVGPYVEFRGSADHMHLPLITWTAEGTFLLIVRQKELTTNPILSDNSGGTKTVELYSQGGVNDRYVFRIWASSAWQAMAGAQGTCRWDRWALIHADWGPAGGRMWINGARMKEASNAIDAGEAKDAGGAPGLLNRADTSYGDTDVAMVAAWSKQIHGSITRRVMFGHPIL